MPARKYRVAVVGGAGTWGRHYLHAYAEHPDCEIVALVDRTRDRRMWCRCSARPDRQRLIDLSYDAPISTDYWDDDGIEEYREMCAKIEKKYSSGEMTDPPKEVR